MRTEILIYDRFEELDAIGPYDVLRRAGFDVAYVTAEPTDRIEASRGTIVVPHREVSERVELLIVPGGPYTRRAPRGTWAQVQRGVLPAAIAARHAAGTTVVAVCTGAFLLAAGGLLDGRPATTHHDDFDDLEGKAAQVIRDARVVDDGDIITSGESRQVSTWHCGSSRSTRAPRRRTGRRRGWSIAATTGCGAPTRRADAGE